MVGYNVPFKSFLKKIYFTVQNMSTITAKTDYKEDLEKLSASLTPHNIQLAKEFDFDITSWK